MLGHLVVSHAPDELHREAATPGWMRRLLNALFTRKR
jgi:hypothetical protein